MSIDKDAKHVWDIIYILYNHSKGSYYMLYLYYNKAPLLQHENFTFIILSNELPLIIFMRFCMLYIMKRQDEINI